jgi:hypothetical protein
MKHNTTIKPNHLIMRVLDYMRKEKRNKRKMRERKEGRNEGGRKEVQIGRRKKKHHGWVEPVAGSGWKRHEEEKPWVWCSGSVKKKSRPWVETLRGRNGRPGSVWPLRPTALATLFYFIFFYGSCSGGFDFF